MELTHFDKDGRARMVDVSVKVETARTAVATGLVEMRPETTDRIRTGQIAKGDVLTVARVAGIMAAKQTAALIPMCHPLSLTSVQINFEFIDHKRIRIEAIVPALPHGIQILKGEAHDCANDLLEQEQII